jgi:hypothetical protein
VEIILGIQNGLSHPFSRRFIPPLFGLFRWLGGKINELDGGLRESREYAMGLFPLSTYKRRPTPPHLTTHQGRELHHF